MIKFITSLISKSFHEQTALEINFCMRSYRNCNNTSTFTVTKVYKKLKGLYLF